jgi:uncharacterized protein with WD repeat
MEATTLVLRSKTSILSYTIDSTSNVNPTTIYSNLNTIPHSHSTLPLLHDPLGQYFAHILTDSSMLHIQSTSSGEVVTTLQAAEFSTMGTFILTYERSSTKGSATSQPDSNLKIWRVATGELEYGWYQKTYKTNLVQWSSDETICMKMGNNEVQVYDGK